MDFAFPTVVCIKKIKKGDEFSKENVWVKRPGTGQIPAEDFDDIIGKEAKNDIAIDSHLKWEDIKE